MHKYLMEMLQCPLCHGELDWVIKRESKERIEEGEATCKACGATYPIKDEIGVFLTPKLPRNDLWEKGSTQLIQYLKEHPKIEDQLINTPLEELSPADQFVRGMVLEEQGKYFEANKAFEASLKGIYTEDYTSCWNKQVEYICDSIDSTDKPIVDLASGRCYLVKELARKKDNYIVATDFSPRVLRHDRLDLKQSGLYDKISLLSFDARITPFKDGAVNILTTNLGLSNIEEPKSLLKELRRIVNGQLMSVIHFYPESDKQNSDVIYKYGFETFTFKNIALKSFIEAGWDVELVNECSGAAKPTPTSKLIEGVQIDGLPVKDTELEWAVLIAK